jgi:hypothetical protein
MKILRTALFGMLAALVLSASPATAQDETAIGRWEGWVQWGDEAPITGVTWQLNANDTLVVHTDPQEFGYWFQVGNYVEMLYPCTQGQYICHYRGRQSGPVISGTATSNEGHRATFEMRRR